MKFAYAYRTPDGIRREDVIESASRAEAFALLRGRGIRPIKVVSTDGGRANGETRFVTRKRVVIAALAAGLCCGGTAVFCLSRADLRDRRVVEVERRGEEIVALHEQMVGTLHLEALRNYREIFTSSHASLLSQKIGLSHFNFRDTRQKLKELFLESYALFPADGHGRERTELERIYQRLMDRVDLGEARIANDAKAFRLLDANRGKWSVQNGRIEWTDPALAADFACYTRDLQN